MKRICVAALVMLTCLNVNSAFAGTPEALKARIENMTEEQKDARYKEMKARVTEIKSMDRSKLTKEERKALKTELKNMNKEAKAIDRGGVYISFAGIIIIILLLIILL
jgi:Flp pilus assembly protein TadB